MTVYNRDTHAFIRDAPRVGRSSQSPGLQANADGRSTSTSARRPGGPGVELGPDRSRTAASRCSPASTVRRSRCSTRPGKLTDIER